MLRVLIWNSISTPSFGANPSQRGASLDSVQLSSRRVNPESGVIMLMEFWDTVLSDRKVVKHFRLVLMTYSVSWLDFRRL